MRGDPYVLRVNHHTLFICKIRYLKMILAPQKIIQEVLEHARLRGESKRRTKMYQVGAKRGETYLKFRSLGALLHCAFLSFAWWKDRDEDSILSLPVQGCQVMVTNCDTTTDPNQHEVKYILSTLYGLLCFGATVLLFFVWRARPAERCRVPLHTFVALSALGMQFLNIYTLCTDISLNRNCHTSDCLKCGDRITTYLPQLLMNTTLSSFSHAP